MGADLQQMVRKSPCEPSPQLTAVIHSVLKRTQRNLFIIMTVMVGIYLILIRLPGEISVGIAVGMIAFALALMLWGRDLLVARRYNNRRRWRDAARHYELFEKKLLAAPWPWLTIPLYLGVYTFDGIALARNNIAQSLIDAGDLDVAERWLRSALLRDPLYALPYVNLGIIAAIRRDKKVAEREMLKAIHLGYPPMNAQRLLRRALERGEQASSP